MVKRSGHAAFITSLAFSPDSRMLVSTDGRQFGVWDVPGRKLLKRPRPVEGCPGIASLAYAADGKLVALGCDNGRTTLWEVNTGQFLDRQLHGGAGEVRFTADGQLQVLDGKGPGARVRQWSRQTLAFIANRTAPRPSAVLRSRSLGAAIDALTNLQVSPTDGKISFK